MICLNRAYIAFDMNRAAEERVLQRAFAIDQIEDRAVVEHDLNVMGARRVVDDKSIVVEIYTCRVCPLAEIFARSPLSAALKRR